ncbi:hypothetical protein EDB89DRAFT_553251 [Lactarius sanguifluus]|nr:hypothetical protein EDB89DRAFT_553251 [Lactarius sanguifluus]
MPVPRVFDFQDPEKSMKNRGRAYQKRSVSMIELCRLFLEISPGNRDQVDALKRSNWFPVYDFCHERAVDAKKGSSTDADNAFTIAGKELDDYAERYHQGHEAVFGDTQNIIRAAADEDNHIVKTQGLLPWQSSVGSTSTNTMRKSDFLREDIRISSGHSSQVRVHFQILTSPTHRLNTKTLICESFHTISCAMIFC